MKNKLIILFLILFGINGSFAQNKNYGIYKNWEDYAAGRLSNVVDPDSFNGKIKLHHLFSSNYIEVIKGEKKYRFCKDSIFGYRDSKQNDYRFYRKRDEEYRILENKTIVIYVANVPVTASSGKSVELVPGYFFSTSLNSAILPLTAQNIRSAFSCDYKIQCILDKEFNGIPISTFDTKNKMYKVNYILGKCLNEQDQK